MDFPLNGLIVEKWLNKMETLSINYIQTHMDITSLSHLNRGV